MKIYGVDMPTYRIVFRYGNDGGWTVISSTNSNEACFNLYNNLIIEHSSDHNNHFKCQVLFGGDYRTIRL